MNLLDVIIADSEIDITDKENEVNKKDEIKKNLSYHTGSDVLAVIPDFIEE